MKMFELKKLPVDKDLETKEILKNLEKQKTNFPLEIPKFHYFLMFSGFLGARSGWPRLGQAETQNSAGGFFCMKVVWTLVLQTGGSN